MEDKSEKSDYFEDEDNELFDDDIEGDAETKRRKNLQII